jgi:hypothetical protein
MKTANAIAAATLAALTLFAVPASAGGRPIPMVEIIDAPVVAPTGKAADIQAVQAAILAGCIDKGWVAHVVSPGLIHATLTKPDYTAELDIPFTASSYSIKYSNSEHLDYSAEKHVIHRNFNRWLILLRERIDVHMAAAST